MSSRHSAWLRAAWIWLATWALIVALLYLLDAPYPMRVGILVGGSYQAPFFAIVALWERKH